MALCTVLQYGITSEGGGLHTVVAKCIYFGLFMFPMFVFSLAVAHLGGHRSVAAQGLPVNLQPWPAAASPCVASNYISPRGASVACVCAWLCLCFLALCGNKLYLTSSTKAQTKTTTIRHHTKTSQQVSLRCNRPSRKFMYLSNDKPSLKLIAFS